MKKVKFVSLSCVVSLLFFTTSCSDSSSSSIECQECHIAYENGVDPEVEVPMLNFNGGEDFCGADLATVEAVDFEYTIAETVVDGITIPAGTYGNGNMEIHCEEHAHE